MKCKMLAWLTYADTLKAQSTKSTYLEVKTTADLLNDEKVNIIIS